MQPSLQVLQETIMQLPNNSTFRPDITWTGATAILAIPNFPGSGSTPQCSGKSDFRRYSAVRDLCAGTPPGVALVCQNVGQGLGFGFESGRVLLWACANLFLSDA